MPFRRLVARSNGARAVAAVAAAVVLAGCASARPPAAPAVAVLRDPSAPCAGHRYVAIRNRTDAEVAVFAVPAGGGAPARLASVGPGTHRLPVDGPLIRAFAEQGGRRLSAGRGRAQRVEFQYQCARG